jgi:hypothetical protein
MNTMITGSTRPTCGVTDSHRYPAVAAVINGCWNGPPLTTELSSGGTLSLLRGSGEEFVGKGGPEWQGLGVGDFGGEVTEFAVGVPALPLAGVS